MNGDVECVCFFFCGKKKCFIYETYSIFCYINTRVASTVFFYIHPTQTTAHDFLPYYINNNKHNMIIPIRCFTCGKVTGNRWKTYLYHRKQGKTDAEALDAIHLDKECCRRIILTNVELIDTVMVYQTTDNPVSKRVFTTIHDVS